MTTKRCGYCGNADLKFTRTDGDEDVFTCRRGRCGRQTRFPKDSGEVTDAGAHPPQTDAVPVASSDETIPAESLREQLAGEELHLYRCRLCFGYTLTVRVDEGEVLPTIGCRAKGFFVCPGAAEPVIGEWPAGAPTEPRWEWVRLSDPDRVPSDENAAVAFSIKHLPLTLKARIASA